jgi:hypothetical protein
MILMMFSPHGKVYFFKRSTNMLQQKKRIAKSKQPRDNLLSKARKSETNSTSAWKQYRIVK